MANCPKCADYIGKCPYCGNKLNKATDSSRIGKPGELPARRVCEACEGHVAPGKTCYACGRKGDNT